MLRRRHLPQNPWHPRELFDAGQIGFVLDASDLDTVFSDNSAVVRATVGATVANLVSSVETTGNSRFGSYLYMPTGSLQPIWRTDGAKYWLEFDGVDDYMELYEGGAYATCAKLMGSTGRFGEILVAARLLSAPTDNTPTYNNTAFWSTTNQYQGMVLRGTNNEVFSFHWDGAAVYSAYNLGASAVGMDLVLSLRNMGVGGTGLGLSVNNRPFIETTAGDLSAGGLAARYWFGYGGGAGTYANMRLYAMVSRSQVFSADERTQLNMWLAAKSGASVGP